MKLLRYFQQLSQRDARLFQEFVDSPYHNKHRGVRKLVGVLVHTAPHFPDRSGLAGRLFPSDADAEKRLAPVLTYTFNLLEKFLVQQQLELEDHQADLLLLRQLRAREWSDLYEKKLRQLLERGSDQYDNTYYRRRADLLGEAAIYFDQTERWQEDRTLQDKQTQLDHYFIAEKLKDACELRIRQRILSVDYRPQFLQAILREVDNHPGRYAAVPPVLVYYRTYRMLDTGSEEEYQRAFGTLRAHEQAFGAVERKTLYNYFQNFCIDQINRGQVAFYQEIFQLYQRQLDQELLIEDGLLSEWHYKNIVTTGLRLEAFEWVHNFLYEYRDRLDPRERENAFSFNLAAYYYATGRYDDVLALLTRIEYTDLRYNLGSKELLLRTYYALEEYDALASLVESFRIYLLRNKLMADVRRKGYYNLFKFTRRAAGIRDRLDYTSAEKNRKDIERLRRAIGQTSNIFNQSWLLRTVDELAEKVDV